MTRDQWETFNKSLDLAPEVMLEMYNSEKMEMTEMESLDLARAIQSGAMALHLASDPRAHISAEELNILAEASISLIAGLYGRLMGLAKAYDEAITKQAVLEAELATTGK